MTTDPTAPDPETVEALAKALYAAIDWDFVETFRGEDDDDPVYAPYLSMCQTVAAHPAMRTLLADTARAAEGKVIERVEAAADGLAAREATWHHLAKHDAYAEGSRDAYDNAEQVVRAALRASEADR